MDVSVIIVNWNTKEILRDCLASVYEQAGDVDCEVIVVDNASTDGSVEMVKNDFERAVLIENAENRGFATANNQGIAVAKGRYVLLLNSDTVVLDGAIAKTVDFADAHPKAGVVGCRVLNPDRTLQPTCFMYPSVLNMFLSSTYLYKLFPRSRFFGRERMTWWDRNDMREVDVVTGCFMLVRREAIDQVGAMDERFFMYAEETDWCYRIKKSGWRIMFTPAAAIVHLGGQSTAKRPVAMIIQLRLSILKFVRKHSGWAVQLIARFLTALFFAVRLPVWFARVFRSRRRSEAAIKMQAYSAGIVDALFGRIDS
ncbi:MAG: glycosyltransferase family 2 protein [Planctomycetota bacterium]